MKKGTENSVVKGEYLACFEKSEVEATVTTPVISIKNSLSGHICVPAVGETVMDDETAKGEVLIGKERCA